MSTRSVPGSDPAGTSSVGAHLPTPPASSAPGAAHASVEHAVTRALAAAHGAENALGAALDAILAITRWEWCAIWVVDRSAQALRLADARSAPAFDTAAFAEISRDTTFECGMGLPGRVWASNAPAWLSDAQVEPNFARQAAARAVGLHAACAFPLACGAQVVGVLECFTSALLPPDAAMLASFESVGGHIGEFIERRHAQIDLGRQRAHLAALVDSALDCIVAMDHQGLVVEWNHAAERTFGWTRAEAVGRELAVLIVPEAQRAQHRAGLARHLAGGPAPVLGARLELTAVRKDGSTFPVEVSITRVAAEGPALFTGFLRDITARKAAEDEANRSRALFRSIAEASPDIVSIYDVRRGAVVYANREIAVTLGYSAQEVLALGDTALARLVHPEDLPRIHATIATFDTLADGQVSEYELRAMHRDGSYRWLLNRTVVFSRLADGRAEQVLSFAQDVTRRKLTEDTLREGEERLRLGLDAGNVGTWDWDIANNRVTWSERVYAFHGLTPETFSGRVEDFQKLIHPEDAARVGAAIQRALSESGAYEAEFRIVRPDGAIRWLTTTGRVYRNTASVPVRMLGATSDVTARRQAEEERDALLESERAARSESERANRLKDEFLATVSHELRTPLNAILGYSQLLQRSAIDSNVKEGLEVIERNARVQTEIINDLLDMSRIISGKLRLDVQRVELPRVVAAAVETVNAAARAKGIRMVSTVDPIVGPVSGDPNRLQQVIWNLLTNAVKFTPKGGRVQIVVGRVNSHVEIAVSDTGRGISAGFLPHVFDKFRQSDASAARVHGGLGLGLALVKNLVEMHGGTVRASSPGEDCGATFTVELPLTALHSEPGDPGRQHPRTPSHPVSDEGPGLDGITVLVVDDEQDSRELVRRILEERGAKTLTAAGADEALAIIQRERIDLLLSDIGMPGVDGYELARRVRALPTGQGGDVPAVALTAFARSEDRTRALIAGYQTHIAKPVEPAELTAAVASLARRRGHRAP